MTTCVECLNEYDPPAGGGILINICPRCKELKAIVRAEIGDCPDSYASHGGVLMPNPSFAEWQKRNDEIRDAYR